LKGLSFPFTHEATFVSRINRFKVSCLLDGKEVFAYLPNPGRLWDILAPGRKVYLAESPEGSLPTLIAAEKDSLPILLHTHYTNRVAQFLIDHGLVPSLSGLNVKGKEVRVRDRRFDLLLSDGREDLILEVKSCTLFGERIALFPDAKTERGAAHLLLLREISKRGMRAGMLFVVHSPKVSFFLPHYHLDAEFSKILFQARESVLIKAVSVGWKVAERRLELLPTAKELEIPWHILKKEAGDRGLYLLVLRLESDAVVGVGRKGTFSLRAGYYIYVGSSKRGLEKRVRRHKRRRKRLFWHMDYLSREAKDMKDIVIRTNSLGECELAHLVASIFSPILGFGSSDCRCPSHLFFSRDNPLGSEHFLRLIQYVQIDRLDDLLGSNARNSPLF